MSSDNGERTATPRPRPEGTRRPRCRSCTRARPARRVARATPTAKNALERSSRCTCTRHRGVAGERERERRRPRPGGDARVPHAARHEPVDQRPCAREVEVAASITSRRRARIRTSPCQSTSPSAVSRPHAAWVAAVPVSTGISSRPVADADGSIGRIASTHAPSPNSAHWGRPAPSYGDADEHAERDRRERGDHGRRYRRPGRARRRSAPRACACRSPRRSGCRAGCWRRRIATARKPSAAPPHHAAAGTVSTITNAVPHGGHQAEEQEHHQLAEAEPGVRARAAAVEHGRDQRERAHDQDQHRLGRERQREPGDAGDPEREQRGHEHRARRGGAARREPRRAEPLGVSTPRTPSK